MIFDNGFFSVFDGIESDIKSFGMGMLFILVALTFSDFLSRILRFRSLFRSRGRRR